MDSSNRIWALVLAAGDGTRLRSLTTLADGVPVPKQFCSLNGGPSLLQEALQRASAIASLQSVCAVVAEHHRRWWERPMSELAAPNVIVQPTNRGTAYGVLLPLLHISARAPDAIVVMMPADHHVQDEATFKYSLRAVAHLAAQQTDSVFMIGIQPDRPDPELGYIVPDTECEMPRASKVRQFVEKPSRERERAFIASGALWNTFILAASARALLDLYVRRLPRDLRIMQKIVARQNTGGGTDEGLTALYRKLAVVDFSRDILEGQEARLQVLSVPQCGWTDLGTPERIAEVVSGLPHRPLLSRRPSVRAATINLAEQHYRAAGLAAANRSCPAAQGVVQ